MAKKQAQEQTVFAAYGEYEKLPLAKNIREAQVNEIYMNQWCVFTELTGEPVNPHRHYTYDEFKSAIQEKENLRKRFLKE